MFDMRPLEEEWKKYRKKKLKPWYVGIIFVVLFILIFFVLNSSKMNLNTFTSYWETVTNTTSLKEDENQEIISQVESNLVLNRPLRRVEVEKEMSEEDEIVEETPENILVDIPILDGKEKAPLNQSTKTRKKIYLDIIKTTNATAYKDVEKRFKQSHDIDDSLFLARSYYKKENYKKSEYWALETNKIDSNIEESMLIFVKSKMKLGRKNEAKNILMRYIKKSNSQEAKKLLYRIENGKF